MYLIEKAKSYFSGGDGGLLFANVTNILAALNSVDIQQAIFFILSILTTILAIYSKISSMKIEKVEKDLNNKKLLAEIEKIKTETALLNDKLD